MSGDRTLTRGYAKGPAILANTLAGGEAFFIAPVLNVHGSAILAGVNIVVANLGHVGLIVGLIPR